MDTLRADHLTHHGYDRLTTPNIAEFARTGTTFMEAVAASPWTGPSVSSIVTGRYPDEIGIHALTDPLPPEAMTLAEQLSSEGYHTAAISSNGYVSQWFGAEQGYDEFFYEEYTGDDDNWTPVFTADRVTDKALKWIETAPRPYFLYVHYMDPHEPYLPPVSWRDRFIDDPTAINTELMLDHRFARVPLSPELFQAIVGSYDAEIAFVDHELGRLLGQLPRDVVVALVGDHGEEFMDHGKFLHGHSVFEELLRVPLVFGGPGSCPGVKIAQPVSHVDIFPTLMDLSGAQDWPATNGLSLTSQFDGRSDVESRTLFSIREWEGIKYVAARRGPWKLIYSAETDQTVLFDLERDPAEQSNRQAENPALVSELLDSISTRQAVLSEPYVDSEEALEERMKRLRALGYIK